MVLALIASLILQAEPKAPPDAGAEQAALKAIRDLFKEEYSKKAPADRVALAKKFLQQAADTKDDAASQYVLLSEARDLAADAGAAEPCMQAVDLQAHEFRIRAVAVRATALAALEKSAKSLEDLKSIGGFRLKAVDEALQMDDLEGAAAGATATSALARRIKELPLISRADGKVKEVVARKAAFESVKRAQEMLKTKPEDPAANLAIGKYACFLKGDWDAGLPLLSKGSNEGLKGLADRELAKPAAAEEQVLLADAWWQVGEKDKELKDAARRRAIAWYQKAVPQLGGLLKVRAEKRILDGRLELISKGTWADLADPKAFGQPGKPGDKILLKGDTPKGAAAECPINGEFDGFSVRVRFESPEPMRKIQIQYPEGKHTHTVLLAPTLYWTLTGADGAQPTLDFTARIVEQDERTITIVASGGAFVVYLDGEEKGRHAGGTGGLGKLKLSVFNGSVSFDQIKLHKKE